MLILVLVFVVTCALVAIKVTVDLREARRAPTYPKPLVSDSLPIDPLCRECVLAREAGTRTQVRHLARAHGYLVMDGATR